MEGISLSSPSGGLERDIVIAAGTENTARSESRHAADWAELSASALPDKSAEIIVYCANLQCHTSENAAWELERLGYMKVRVFPEGKQGWLDAGLELEASTRAENLLTINPD